MRLCLPVVVPILQNLPFSLPFAPLSVFPYISFLFLLFTLLFCLSLSLPYISLKASRKLA